MGMRFGPAPALANAANFTSADLGVANAWRARFRAVNGHEPPDDPIEDPLDARAAMADWDERFQRWQHAEGLRAMRESDDANTRQLADACNCRLCRPMPMPGPGRSRLG